MLQTFDAVIQPNGYIGFRDQNPPVFYEPTEVFITIRKPVISTVAQHIRKPNGAAILEKLRKKSFPVHLKRSAEEIQAQINEERNAWD
jgi:hypothetical protein